MATLAPFADEICVFPGTPMPAADPSLFVAFALPLSTPGVLVLCRDHYGSRASPHDAPFSARFDEQDAYVVFDEVEVPWHRIFLDGDGEIYHLVRERGWIANIMQQTCIRAQVKLELAHELCTRMAEALGLAERRDVEEMLGEIWSYGEIVRTAVVAAEAEAHDDFGDGVMFCNERPFAAIRGLIPLWMERVNAIIRSFGSHYLLITPSERDLASDELNPYHRSYLRGVDGTEPFERSRLFRAGWDLACSALGSRSLLFEQFYLGSTATSFSSAHRRATVSRKVSWSALF